MNPKGRAPSDNDGIASRVPISKLAAITRHLYNSYGLRPKSKSEAVRNCVNLLFDILKQDETFKDASVEEAGSIFLELGITTDLEHAVDQRSLKSLSKRISREIFNSEMSGYIKDTSRLSEEERAAYFLKVAKQGIMNTLDIEDDYSFLDKPTKVTETIDGSGEVDITKLMEAKLKAAEAKEAEVWRSVGVDKT